MKALKVDDIDFDKFKAEHGGSFPVCKGRRYRYPRPDNEEAWKKLVCRSMNYRMRQREAAKKGKTLKRDYKLEYIYHCRPEQRKRRAQRNKDRAKLAEKGVDLKKKDVHHIDSEKLKKPVVLTEKEHSLVHSKKSKTGKKARKGKVAATPDRVRPAKDKRVA